VRLTFLVGGLLIALIVGFALGRASGVGAGSTAGGAMGSMPPSGHTHGPTDSHPGTALANSEVGGLAVSAGGYTLITGTTTFAAGVPGELRFRIEAPDRRPLTTFAVAHDKRMHLIVARHDLTGYQHLHPTMAPDGTWRVPLTLPRPGAWRAYADFAAVGANGAQTPVTLGVDLTVPGAYGPTALPRAARESAVDGLTVTFEGTPQIGASAPLMFRVYGADGSPLTDLERYLGAYGHLVVLREGDLGYVHVHPEDQLSGGAVKFWLAAPSPGRYRMFLDFQRAGTVHTAAYTLVVA
jgi:hypothetical protein